MQRVYLRVYYIWRVLALVMSNVIMTGLNSGFRILADCKIASRVSGNHCNHLDHMTGSMWWCHDYPRPSWRTCLFQLFHSHGLPDHLKVDLHLQGIFVRICQIQTTRNRYGHGRNFETIKYKQCVLCIDVKNEACSGEFNINHYYPNVSLMSFLNMNNVFGREKKVVRNIKLMTVLVWFKHAILKYVLYFMTWKFTDQLVLVLRNRNIITLN